MNITQKYVFNAETRRALFGHEDATQEDMKRLKSYFVKKKDYETVSSDLNFCIVLGRKGTGKSATLKYAYNADIERGDFSIWIRPDDITELYNGLTSESEITNLVLLWKKGLSRLIACKLAEKTIFTANGDISTVLSWAYESGYKAKDLITQLSSKFKIKATGIEGDMQNLPSERTVGEHHILSRIVNHGIRIYMDDLDRGWSPTPIYASRLKALIVALGDLASDIKLFSARISLRTDVYDYLNDDEEFFDKYETSLVWCYWDNADILKVLVKRMTTYFNINISDEYLNTTPQKNIAMDFFPPIIETTFVETRVWNNKKTYRVLMSLIRGLPRDLVKILNAAAEKAFDANRNMITGQDFCDILDRYSVERLKDISREFSSELARIRDFLLNLGPTVKEKLLKREKRYLYKTSELLTKIEQAVDHVGKTSLHFTWTNQLPTPLDLAHFLYKIGFITARKDFPGKIYRTNFDKAPYLLTRQYGDKGYSWEIHPAYRAALYTYDPSDISWEATIDITDSESDD